MKTLHDIKEYFSNLLDRLFGITTYAALADLERAKSRLRKAVAHHDKCAETHEYLAEAHTAQADAHSYSAARAERVITKLSDLLG